MLYLLPRDGRGFNPDSFSFKRFYGILCNLYNPISLGFYIKSGYPFRYYLYFKQSRTKKFLTERGNPVKIGMNEKSFIYGLFDMM